MSLRRCSKATLLQFDAAVVGFQDGCGDRQAETGATTVVRTVWIGAGEPVEHVGGGVRGDARILVVDRQHTQLPLGQVVLGRGWRASAASTCRECLKTAVVRPETRACGE
jgi:hypothetical protein